MQMVVMDQLICLLAIQSSLSGKWQYMAVPSWYASYMKSQGLRQYIYFVASPRKHIAIFKVPFLGVYTSVYFAVINQSRNCYVSTRNLCSQMAEWGDEA